MEGPNLRYDVMGRSSLVNAACGLIAALLLVAGPAAWAEDPEIAIDTPDATIRSLQRGLIAAAEDRALTVDGRYERLHALVTTTHELGYIAELAVRRNWDELDADQRSRYVAAFETLSVMTYASRFSNVASDSFLAVTTRNVAAGNADVSTGIRTVDGEEISLDYQLRQSSQGWRIINIVADGVSDLALKRAEYRRILTERGVEPLLAELARQIEELRSR